mgnify:CR=1 FL=1
MHRTAPPHSRGRARLFAACAFGGLLRTSPKHVHLILMYGMWVEIILGLECTVAV